MRITSEILHKNAEDLISRRARTDHGLLAVYLQGSLLDGDPLIGGSGDIDLFFIHTDPVSTEREIIRLTDEVHIDVAHHSRNAYRQKRGLRLHPWLGPAIAGCKILYDPQHFMDFTQASVRGQFDQPTNILARARVQCDSARQIWMSFQLEGQNPGVHEVAKYLRAVVLAANALASLNGPPLTERRLLQKFPARALALGQPGLFNGLLGLLGGPYVDTSTLRSWLPKWRAAFQLLPTGEATGRLHPFRLNYYLRYFDSLLSSAEPHVVLWPLIRNWVKAIQLLPSDSPACADWEEAGYAMHLLGPDFSERIAALDAYLDTVEEILEKWAEKAGA